MSEIYVHEPSTSGKVVLHTSLGDLDIELWSRECPVACRNFLQLCYDGYYNGLTFHRVIKDFIVQTGDPTGTGRGGSDTAVNDGQLFDLEIHPRLKFRYRGLVGVANLCGGAPAERGRTCRLKGTNGNQFFITLNRCDALNNTHTLFGKVTGHSLYNLLKFNDVEVDKEDRPLCPPTIKSTEVVWLPFPDLQPRAGKQEQRQRLQDSSNRQRGGSNEEEEEEEEEEKKKKKTKNEKLQKFNRKLLSFGEVVEEEEEDKHDTNEKEEEEKEEKERGCCSDEEEIDNRVILAGNKGKKEKVKSCDDEREQRRNRDISLKEVKTSHASIQRSSKKKILSAHDVLNDDPLLLKSSNLTDKEEEDEDDEEKRRERKEGQISAGEGISEACNFRHGEDLDRERRRKRRRESLSEDERSHDDDSDDDNDDDDDRQVTGRRQRREAKDSSNRRNSSSTSSRRRRNSNRGRTDSNSRSSRSRSRSSKPCNRSSRSNSSRGKFKTDTYTSSKSTTCQLVREKIAALAGRQDIYSRDSSTRISSRDRRIESLCVDERGGKATTATTETEREREEPGVLGRENSSRSTRREEKEEEEEEERKRKRRSPDNNENERENERERGIERGRERRREREGRKIEVLRLYAGGGSANRGMHAEKERLPDSNLMTEKEKSRQLHLLRRRDTGRQQRQVDTLVKLDAFTQQLRNLRERQHRQVADNSSNSNTATRDDASNNSERKNNESRHQRSNSKSNSSNSRNSNSSSSSSSSSIRYSKSYEEGDDKMNVSSSRESENEKKIAEPGTLNALLPDLDEEIDENDGSWLSGGGLRFAVDSNRAYELDDARAAASVVVYDPLRGAPALASKKMQERRHQQAVGWKGERRDIEKW